MLNPDGTAPPTADYELTFNIYDAASGGTLIWGPQRFNGQSGPGLGAKVPVVQGYFNVMLGPQDTATRGIANAFNAETRYVELRVGTNPPVSPRQRILSAPYAMKAAWAETAGQAGNSTTLAGFDWGAILASGTNPVTGKIDGTKISNGSIALSQLVARSVGPNVLAGGLAASDTVTNFTVSGVTLATNVPGLRVTLTTTGRPVMVMLVTGQSGPGPGHPGSITVGNVTSFSGVTVSLWRNGNRTFSTQLSLKMETGSTIIQQLTVPSSSVQFLDTPQAEPNTYEVTIQSSDSNDVVNFFNTRLIAYEL